MTPTDRDPSPDPDPRPEDPRLTPYWRSREEMRPALIRIAKGSGFDETLREWLVDEVLERLADSYLQENPPREDDAWCRCVIRRCLGEIRKLPSFHLLQGDLMDDREERKPRPIPGIQAFWTWLASHCQVLEPLCSPLEWQAILGTRDTPSIEQAAKSCGQTERDYRNLLERAGGKFFSAILRNLVPPPPSVEVSSADFLLFSELEQGQAEHASRVTEDTDVHSTDDELRAFRSHHHHKFAYCQRGPDAGSRS